MNEVRILAFSGSLRRGSYNTSIARAAAAGAERAGAAVTFLELAELDLPLFSEDLERDSGMPAGALRLKQELAAAQGVLIASPEYNSSLTAALKNALDWASRKATPDERAGISYRGKVASLLAASPGSLGGLRGLVHLRAILGNLGMHVVPGQRAVSKVHESLDAQGAVTNAKLRARLDDQAAELVRVCRLLHSSESGS